MDSKKPMKPKIQEILAKRKAKVAEMRKKTSNLHPYLSDMISLLNGGALWVDIAGYLESEGVKTKEGQTVSKNAIADFCKRHVPAYDLEHGTTEDEKSGREVMKPNKRSAAKRKAPVDSIKQEQVPGESNATQETKPNESQKDSGADAKESKESTGFKVTSRFSQKTK